LPLPAEPENSCRLTSRSRKVNPAPRGSAAELTGIARLAASSPLAEAKRGTEYFLLPVRSVLNRCDSDRVPFPWTVNPYRGCEFGCRYCYARYTHEFMELEPSDFEKKVFVKEHAAEVLAHDLEQKLRWTTSGFAPAEHIAIGTATDPYQPAEREFGVTRGILERMAEHTGLSVSITTKSDQVLRDLDLLRRIAARSSLWVNLSITTPRPRLARLLEPRAPRPDLRFEAVRKLREAGLAAGVFVMPVLPGLTDRQADLEMLAQTARDVGAQWLAAAVLFLMPASFQVFLPFLAQRFPRLAREYGKWYSRSAYAPEDYRKEISAQFARLRKKYGLGSGGYLGEAAGSSAHAAQLSLGLEVSEAVSATSPASSPAAPALVRIAKPLPVPVRHCA
jgi:DNA repair photolyase